MTTIRIVALAMGLLLGVQAAWAAELSGRKAIRLVPATGPAVEIGHITFTKDGTGASYALVIYTENMTDHFLSMREFKCLEGGPELVCRVPYPYDNPHRVSSDDFRWLEHDLMFLHKSPSDYGANLWNGLYYKLRPDGDGLTGIAQDIDLNHIAGPPDDPTQPPYTEAELNPSEASNRWFPTLRID